MSELERMKLEAEEFKQEAKDEKFLDEIASLNDQLSLACAHLYDKAYEIERLTADNERLRVVMDAADKCKHGCRRCNADDRYINLRKALAAVEQDDDRRVFNGRDEFDV